MCFVVYGEEGCDYSKFMEIPNDEEEQRCYQAFYDATSNASLCLEVCPVCARERLVREGEVTRLLSDPSIQHILATTKKDEMTVLHHFLKEVVSCWMCLDCMKALE